MKHFDAQTGGRYTYVEDVNNLQELALAINHIFDGCDNFVISGCEVSGSTIAPGFVFINGEIREFSGKTGVTTWPQYVYERNTTETVSYVSGGEKTGRITFGTSIASSVPSASDPITHAAPKYITFNRTGALTIKEVFFGRYAMLLNPGSNLQTVNGPVSFASTMSVNGLLSAKGGLAAMSGANRADFGWEDTSTCAIKTTIDNKAYKFAITNNGGFVFSINNTPIFAINNSPNDVTIVGATSVNIGPSIKENGVLLSEKYVLKTTYDTAMAQKVSLSDVYTKTQGDNRYAQKANGLSQFVTSTNTKAVLRSHIDAYGKSEVEKLCPTKDNLLSDMITTEEQKSTVRNLLGVMAASETQAKLKDTGWVLCYENLYARQIGDVLYFSGNALVSGDDGSVVFTLPAQFDTPSKGVIVQGHDGGVFSIYGGTKHVRRLKKSAGTSSFSSAHAM